MGLFGDIVKEALGGKIESLEKNARDRARNMSDSEILRALDNSDVKPLARKALEEEAERRGLR